MISTLFSLLLFIIFSLLWKFKADKMRSGNIEAEVLKDAIRPTQVFFRTLKKVMTLSFLLIINSSIFFGHWWLLIPYPGLNNFFMKLAGLALGLAGLFICHKAHQAMGDSWRVGIDEEHVPTLIDNGMYASIRNPTYLGLFLLVFGVLLINPSSAMLIWSVAFVLQLEFQVRCEEEYLEGSLGEKYATYRSKTKRYIPKLY